MPCFDCACKQASMRPRRAAANRDLNTVPTWVDKLCAFGARQSWDGRDAGRKVGEC